MMSERLRVSMAPDGFYPQSICWRGRGVRVLGVEDVYTCGPERRLRLRTPEGTYELGYHTDARIWQMRRAPTWWQRLRSGVRQMPRYPLPAGRRRGPRRPAVQADVVPRWPTPALARVLAS